jgi:hypothetical protein
LAGRSFAVLPYQELVQLLQAQPGPFAVRHAVAVRADQCQLAQAADLVHPDETEIRLKVGSGYVWVFTNLEEVVYQFKPNREVGFLYDLLKGFSGALVSDFFSASDSLPCPQQK